MITDPTKPLKQLMFSKTMNASVKQACKIRLEVMLTEEERMLSVWHERHKKYLNQTRREQVERNLHKRISALRIVCWMLSSMGDRGDLPPMVIKKPKDLKPKKEPKLLDAPPPQDAPVISQENLNVLLNLAKILNQKPS